MVVCSSPVHGMKLKQILNNNKLLCSKACHYFMNLSTKKILSVSKLLKQMKDSDATSEITY